LVWLYILGQINDGKEVKLSIKKLNKKFNIPKSKYYRILRFGLMFFNKEVNGIYIVNVNGILSIQVIRGGSIKKEVKSIKKTPIKDVKTKPKKVLPNELVVEVIKYLNIKVNKNFNHKTVPTINLINKRVKEGYTLDNFKYVIDVKVGKWINTEQADYLRPNTLFGNKMEGYLNEKIIKNERNDKFTQTQSAVNRAKAEVDWFPKE
jgi:uncharacterized phage protein (TIGR02220 family)